MKTRAAVTALLLLAASPSGAGRGGQEQERASEYIAFRFDATHVIATLKVLDGFPQVRDGLSPEPLGRYGYRYFEPSKALLDKVPAHSQSAARSWLVHAAPGRSFTASVERVVGGNPGCMDAVGVLLRLEPRPDAMFAMEPARYFVAQPVEGELAVSRSAPSRIGLLSSPVLTPDQQRDIESALNEVLKNELPRVQVDKDGVEARLSASPRASDRFRARERKRVDDELAKGRGKLTYDVQAFRLGPDDTPTYFVRAEWWVDKRMGFAATVWMRGAERFTIFEKDVRPASWLRMGEFRGRVHRSQLGFVLNVLDRDRDGWGEILFAQEGYEGVGIQLLEFSPSGFEATGISVLTRVLNRASRWLRAQRRTRPVVSGLPLRDAEKMPLRGVPWRCRWRLGRSTRQPASVRPPGRARSPSERVAPGIAPCGRKAAGR